MVQFEELMLRLENSKSDIDDLADALGLKSMLSEIQQLELRATEPNFWDDIEKSQKVLQKTGALKGIVEEYGTPEQIFDNPQSPKTKAFLANSLDKY